MDRKDERFVKSLAFTPRGDKVPDLDSLVMYYGSYDFDGKSTKYLEALSKAIEDELEEWREGVDGLDEVPFRYVILGRFSFSIKDCLEDRWRADIYELDDPFSSERRDREIYDRLSCLEWDEMNVEQLKWMRFYLSKTKDVAPLFRDYGMKMVDKRLTR